MYTLKIFPHRILIYGIIHDCYTLGTVCSHA